MGRAVGVVPAGELARRPNLFRALAAAFDLSFEGRDAAATGGLDRAIVFGESPDTSSPTPTFRVIGASERGSAADVRFAAGPPVDSSLHGRTLVEGQAPIGSLAARPGERVLATCGGRPVWLGRRQARGWSHSVAVAPDELAPGEALADQLAPGRFVSLLPLIEFLRSADDGWTVPPLRAAYIFDDPNLHALSYGHIDYQRLAVEARRHGFHAVMATIPHDLAFASRAAVGVFAKDSDVLSMAIHGNDHIAQELARNRTEVGSLSLAAQAIRRIASFEQRTGLLVSRVMCAPFEVCSEQTMRALFRTGFEGLAIEQGQLNAASERDDVLRGFLPADRSASGLPVLPRHLFDVSRDRLVLTAFLRRPLLMYGHHFDVAGGYERLELMAEFINSLGDVRWGPLAAAARLSYAWRIERDTLVIRLYCRAASLELPQPVQHVVVTLPGAGEIRGVEIVIRSTPESREVSVEVKPGDAVDANDVAPPRWTPWPTLRRTATELRDRVSAVGARN